MAQAEKEQAKSYAQAAKKAKSIWNATKEITKQDDHLYLLKKRIQPHHARLKELPSSLDNGYENGFSANQLVIPVQDSTGKLTTLQFINPDGSKKFLQDGKKRGCYSVLNRMDKPRIIAIAEGFATIASISEDAYIQNNGYLCVMGLDADNLPLVARAMREQYPTTDIIVFGDIGDTGNKGEIKAREAAKAVNGYCVLPPMTKGDFNDYLTSDNVTVSLEDLIFNAVNHDSLDTISNTATQHQQHHHQRQNL